MFRRPNPPDALFCANDLSALGAIDALRELGLRVPDDVLVCGFDGIPATSWGAYELTTFRQDGQRMVEEDVKLIERRSAAEDASTGVSVVVPPEFIEPARTRSGQAIGATASMLSEGHGEV